MGLERWALIGLLVKITFLLPSHCGQEYRLSPLARPRLYDLHCGQGERVVLSPSMWDQFTIENISLVTRLKVEEHQAAKHNGCSLLVGFRKNFRPSCTKVS